MGQLHCHFLGGVHVEVDLTQASQVELSSRLGACFDKLPGLPITFGPVQRVAENRQAGAVAACAASTRPADSPG